MKHLGVLLVAMALVAGSAGCTRNLGDFTILATKNVDFSRLDTTAVETGTTVQATQGSVFEYPSLKEAVDKAIEPERGVGLTNARLRFRWFLFFNEFQVEGNPIVQRG